jgi:hypothetical protein
VQPITSSHAKRQTTRRARRKKKAIILRLRDAFIEILKIKRWKHMQDIWTEHMRYDLDVKRTTAIFASALEIDTEPSTEHPHAIENLPITEPEPLKTKEPRANAIDIVPPPTALETPTKELAPPSDDDSAKSAGRSEKRRRARRGSSSSAPAQAVQAKLPGTKHATTFTLKPGNTEVAKEMDRRSMNEETERTMLRSRTLPLLHGRPDSCSVSS